MTLPNEALQIYSKPTISRSKAFPGPAVVTEIRGRSNQYDQPRREPGRHYPRRVMATSLKKPPKSGVFQGCQRVARVARVARWKMEVAAGCELLVANL